MVGLVSDFKLSPGEDTGIFPKVDQVNVRVLNEGEEMSNDRTWVSPLFRPRLTRLAATSFLRPGFSVELPDQLVTCLP